jgi:hypothetical protein
MRHAIATNGAGARSAQLRRASDVTYIMEQRDSHLCAKWPVPKPTPDVVAVPQRHDGVGNALRSAFTPPCLPEDWLKLLGKLH